VNRRDFCSFVVEEEGKRKRERLKLQEANGLKLVAVVGVLLLQRSRLRI
jgi:hypothetical protein